MSSSTGLSRRRVPTSAPDTPDRAAQPADVTHNTPTFHAGTALAGGSKVAYDPRDLLDEGDSRGEGKLPKLTIMEEVLLLGLKDKQGYLSFWNDNISYALRGCILIELALRRRIAMVRDPARRRFPLPDRLIEVIDERQTGETLLDEALKMIKTSEKMGVGSWVDLMSGETWNVMKIGFQLKQVRERLAKGLVDKGVLRTEKRNFLLFDMATHPVADVALKADLSLRVVSLLTSRTAAIPPNALAKEEGVRYRITRSVCLVCAAHAANVLENPLSERLGYEQREDATARCEDIMAAFSQWPFGSGDWATGRVGSNGRDQVVELVKEARKEIGEATEGGEDLCFEIIATVLDVFLKMDSLI
ncbi:hypothetical protein BOTBODRAFT_103432 [Botryobasidium botryosum FD-172 SS1]|uniref:GPP34-domain-containing protein n=1 Tax=Botryobasidium botryosum (strain FD-172 SS1) TaxID=930990 RepID=A0A067N4R8_BOTB1|nr:hypothetical protein BOTBODRAFT_103432 [Botryobasidium botryosum FD-172 SS1]